MSNYIEYKDKIAFHPGYYIEELVEESGLTQRDFANRLGTTPKNLSILIRGEQSLSIDIAMKLSRMVNTSINYWLNLQRQYDSVIAEFMSEQELEKERKLYKSLDYNYFQKNFNLPSLPRKIDKQIEAVRGFLNVASLTVLTNEDMAVSFRSSVGDRAENNIVKANIMVQIASNITLEADAPKYNKHDFEKAVEYALTLTGNHEDFYNKIEEAFYNAGVVLVALPNISGSKINGATKKVGDNIMLMVNDRRKYADTFWFTLFHEIGHITNGDYGISFEKETGEKEELANDFARNELVPLDKYMEYVSNDKITRESIIEFSNQINRDVGIVVGRLQNDGYIKQDDREMNSLRSKYCIEIGPY